MKLFQFMYVNNLIFLGQQDKFSHQNRISLLFILNHLEQIYQMGNQCDQCQGVTQGCKRQNFRTQLKNREKLDLSRAQGQDKSRSKLQAINNLRNVSLAQDAKNQSNKEDAGNSQQLEIIYNKQPPQREQGNSKPTKYQYKESTTANKQLKEQKRQSIGRQGNSQLSGIYEDLKPIKLPMESGIDKRNKFNLQEIEKNLLLSRQPTSNYRRPENTVTHHNNSTIRIEDSIKQSKLEHEDKQNSIKAKNTIRISQKASQNFNYVKQPTNEQLPSEYLASSSPSKILRQFNSSLQQSPIRPLTHHPKTSINPHNDQGLHYDQQSFTEQLRVVQQQAFYVRPGVYFEGFASSVNKKLEKQGNILFQSDRTDMIVNFRDGKVDTRVNVMLGLSDGAVFEGLVKSEHQRGEFMASGQGKFVFPDGSYYVGDWLKNLPHGKGRHRFPDGSSYQGEFIEGRKQGQGKFSTSQGDLTYQGSFLADKIQGYGQMQIIDPTTGKKRIYKGYFKNGKLQGQDCQAIYVDEQAKYRGSFIQGKKDGHGKYYYGDGRTWEGEWRDNRQNGFGRYKNQKGVVVEGYWIDGIKSDDGLRR